MTAEVELRVAKQEGECFRLFTCFPLLQGFIYMASVLSLWSTAESDEVYSGV